MATSSSITKVPLKLYVDPENDKVVFAEASKVVIDFLFDFLCLPISTVVKLVSTNGMVGSLGNLYQSVENLNQSFMQPNQTKDVLLNPIAQISCNGISGFLTSQKDEDLNYEQRTKLYMCSDRCNLCVTNDYTTRCAGSFDRHGHFGYYPCSNNMNFEVSYRNMKVDENKSFIHNGFVKDEITFIVMDDLVIQPISKVSDISTLLKKFNVKDINTLQEKDVEIGMDESIKLLKASLETKMVLTSVFHKKKY
ncbi:uncharacterized protein LOC127098103 [Lathyrus oleraceus]|nr:uncharacterized protein LOC127098103 [Pisum sativum]